MRAEITASSITERLLADAINGIPSEPRCRPGMRAGLAGIGRLNFQPVFSSDGLVCEYTATLASQRHGWRRGAPGESTRLMRAAWASSKLPANASRLR